MLTKNDYRILVTIYQFNCTNEMKSITINKISEMTNLSMSKVRRAINLFKEIKYIKEGIVQRNAKTYYITKKGIDKIIKLI